MPLPSLLTAILACSGSPGTDTGHDPVATDGGAADGGSADGGSDGGTSAGCTDCLLDDSHSAPIAASLTVASQDLKAATDATFDWSQLTTDMFGQPLSPDDIQTVTLYLFAEISQEQILDGLAQDTLEQSSVRGFWTCTPTAATCALSDFELVGHAFLPASDFPADTGPWMLHLGTDHGIRALSFLAPTSSADSSLLQLTDDSSQASLTAQLDEASPLAVTSHASSLDWSGVATNGFGGSVTHNRLDRVRIDRFDLDPDMLGAQLMDLDSLSAGRWEASTGGASSIDLGDLGGDTAWPGFSADATWLFSAWCSTCPLPIPHIVAELRAQ